MGTKDPRIDAYIAKSAGFAQPILKHLRELVHRGCPEAEETLYRMADRREARGNAPEAAANRPGVDCRRQIAELEIHAVLARMPLTSSDGKEQGRAGRCPEAWPWNRHQARIEESR